MSLTDGTGLSATDIMALTGNNDGFGNGNSGWWIILLLLCLNGGFGNWGNQAAGGGALPYMMNQTNDIQNGFNQQAVMSALTALSTAMTTGFANASVDACNKAMNLSAQLSSDKFDTITTLNNGHNAILQQMGVYEMARQQCCCDSKAAIADLKSVILAENCADRTALDNSTRDIIQAINAGVQSLKDQSFQQQLDAERRENANLREQMNMMNLANSQAAQTAQLEANNQAQTAQIMNFMNPPYARPFYDNRGGCGCGNFG